MLKKEENKNTNNFRANPARVINWLRVWKKEEQRRRIYQQKLSMFKFS